MRKTRARRRLTPLPELAAGEHVLSVAQASSPASSGGVPAASSSTGRGRPVNAQPGTAALQGYRERRRNLMEFRCVRSGNVAAAEDGSTPPARHIHRRIAYRSAGWSASQGAAVLVATSRMSEAKAATSRPPIKRRRTLP